MHDRIPITTSDATLLAYVVRPRVLPAPAVVLVPEILGVNADMRQSCAELAAQGYLAICPDLFARVEPGLELTDQSEAERAKAAALYGAFDLESGVSDVAAVVEAARRMQECNGSIGIVGYCLGGLLAYLAVARITVGAAVAYYPGNAQLHLGDAPAIATPFLAHLAQEDEYMPREAQNQIGNALAKLPRAQVHSYAGCGHAFARQGGLRYDADAARLANDRTLAFLEVHLRGAPSRAE